jgi:hypothetical protein
VPPPEHPNIRILACELDGLCDPIWFEQTIVVHRYKQISSTFEKCAPTGMSNPLLRLTYKSQGWNSRIPRILPDYVRCLVGTIVVDNYYFPPGLGGHYLRGDMLERLRKQPSTVVGADQNTDVQARHAVANSP